MINNTLSNVDYLIKSMDGVIYISDGLGTNIYDGIVQSNELTDGILTIQNGTISGAINIYTQNIYANNLYTYDSSGNLFDISILFLNDINQLNNLIYQNYLNLLNNIGISYTYQQSEILTLSGQIYNNYNYQQLELTTLSNFVYTNYDYLNNLNFNINSVSSVSYGTNPSVTLYDISGYNYYFNFILETGPQGSQGPQGNQGPAGDTSAADAAAASAAASAVVSSAAASASAASAAASAASAAAAEATLIGINTEITAIQTRLTEDEANITTLQNQTQNISTETTLNSTIFNGSVQIPTLNSTSINNSGTITTQILSTNNLSNVDNIESLGVLNIGDNITCTAINIGNANTTVNIESQISTNGIECFGSINASAINSNNLYFANTSSGQTMNIGTNASSTLLTPNYINIGSGYDLITFNGNVVFSFGDNIQFNAPINQI